MAAQSAKPRNVCPCVHTTPFGLPVVPEVKRMSEVSSGPRLARRASSVGWIYVVAAGEEVAHASAPRGPSPRRTTVCSRWGRSWPASMPR